MGEAHQQSHLAASLAVWLAAASPAPACPEPFAERYMLWFGLPKLLPGEVAIEIDPQDARFRETLDAVEPIFKVKAVLAGQVSATRVRVKSEGSACSHTVGASLSGRLILIGHVRTATNGESVVVARYMPYADPIAVEARLPLSPAKP